MVDEEARYRTLGELIRRQRELAELPMRQFAAMVGISNPYLSQIERNLREPSERVLDAIAEHLQMSTVATRQLRNEPSSTSDNTVTTISRSGATETCTGSLCLPIPGG